MDAGDWASVMDEVWRSHSRQWALVGPPLRPSPFDVAVVHDVAGGFGRPPRVLLLGVTPEVACLAWPVGTRLRAVDRSVEMIGEVWPRHGLPEGAVAEVGDWEALPMDRGADLVVADGAFICLPWPLGAAGLLARVAGALAPDGRAVLRFFVRPDRSEPIDQVADDLWMGRLAGFNTFKLRLLAAVAGDGPQVRLADVHEAFEQIVPDRAALARRLGWDLAVIGTIDAYRGSEAVYALPTRDEVALAVAVAFRVEAVCVGDYQLAERCPSFVLSPR